MANILMVITNEPFIAKSQLHYLDEFDEFNEVSPYDFDLTDGLVNSAVTAWKSISSEEEKNLFISINDCNSKYNIIYVPFSALCFTIAKDRANHNTADRYVILSIKETYRSRLVDLGLYSIYLDSRKKITPTILMEYFDSITENILLKPDYDIILEIAKVLYQKPNHGLISEKISMYLEMTT